MVAREGSGGGLPGAGSPGRLRRRRCALCSRGGGSAPLGTALGRLRELSRLGFPQPAAAVPCFVTGGAAFRNVLPPEECQPCACPAATTEALLRQLVYQNSLLSSVLQMLQKTTNTTQLRSAFIQKIKNKNPKEMVQNLILI